MDYKNLTNEEKDKLIEVMSLSIGRREEGLMYYKNYQVIDKVTDIYKSRLDEEINMNGY